MSLRRSLSAALPFVSLLAGCPAEPVLRLVDCKAVWTCDEQETAQDDNGDEDLCLDVNDAERQAAIDAHVEELQADCNAIAVDCIGGTPAVCTATCAATSTECAADAGS